MSDDNTRPTLADFVFFVISPVLIMAMVGSLVLFLAMVVNVGKYEARLMWVLFWFVMAVVLIARISMNDAIGSRARIYGLILGSLVLLGLHYYVEYPNDSFAGKNSWAVNLGLMAIVWWCAHKLTWDCTLIEQTVDRSGTGLLEVAGLEAGPPTLDSPKVETAPSFGSKKRVNALLAWLDRLLEYRAKRPQKPRTPGVWVVYFSLAALPIFGIGQSLIPLTDTARRQTAFWLMAGYVASGLGLLLSSTLLGLRSYLRYRRMRMPVAITSVWLAVGGTMIGVLLTVGALLPRPHPEYPFVTLGKFGRDDSAERSGLRSPDEKDKSGSKSDPAEKDSRPSEKGGSKNEKGSGKNGTDKADQKSPPATMAKAEQPSPSASSGHPVPSILERLQPIFKFIIIGLVVLMGAFFVLRALLSFLANFTGWARGLLDALYAWWQGLLALGSRSRGPADDGIRSDEESKPVSLPFASFFNPYRDGTSRSASLEKLVRHSFNALQAFARERKLERGLDETPLEFTERLTEELPGLSENATQLAHSYAAVAYAQQRLPESTHDSLRQLWQALEELDSRVQHSVD